MRSLLEKEEKRIENNNMMNKSVVNVTYIIAAVFLFMVGYIIYFMLVESTAVIANSANRRADKFADKIVRGSILTSDGKVVAETKVDKSGKEKRNYPEGKMFSHVVGYDSYGRSGLELDTNFYLLTSNANIFERTYNTLREKKNKGDNVVSTLDYNMQQTAYKALSGVQGAIMVMEPATGKVLAMVSKPDFDPNDIDNVWKKATAEDSKETMLLNRATQGLYAPGSTFKILTALEYINEYGNAYKKYSYECEGKSTFDDVSIKCAHNEKHGKVDLASTLAHSCNTSVANIGTKISAGGLKTLCEGFLYNSDLPYSGVYSKSRFKLDTHSSRKEIPQTVIGQGETLITPLHNLMIISAIANGGVLMKPYLIDSVENYAGVRVKKFTGSSYGSLLSADKASLISKMLEGVINDGTATKYLKDAKYSVAGKTGTAEYGSDGNVNSWFIGYSNVDDPDIAVSIVIEDADTAGVKAAAVARKLFDTYYKNAKD